MIIKIYYSNGWNKRLQRGVLIKHTIVFVLGFIPVFYFYKEVK